MKRTTIMLPEKLKVLAKAYARSNKISLGELIRKALEHELKRDKLQDVLFKPIAVYDVNVPVNIAAAHDKYLSHA